MRKCYSYLRISTDKQSVENQRFEILKFADEKKLVIDEWVEETQSGTIKVSQRDLGKLINRMSKNQTLIISELSRLGRSLLDVMSTLNLLMEKECYLYSVKERFELGDNINSKVLAFAFGLSAEIERSMISSRTKEALQRKKANGEHLGRAFGTKIYNKKLSNYKNDIIKLTDSGVSYRSISRLYDVHPLTVKRFVSQLKCGVN